MNGKAAGSQSGFTLIEVMIATFILLAGLLSLAAAFTQGMVIIADLPNILAAKEAAATVADILAVQRDTQNILPVDGSRDIVINQQTYTVTIKVEQGQMGEQGQNWLDVYLTVPYKNRTRTYSTTTTIRN